VSCIAGATEAANSLEREDLREQSLTPDSLIARILCSYYDGHAYIIHHFYIKYRILEFNCAGIELVRSAEIGRMR